MGNNFRVLPWPELSSESAGSDSKRLVSICARSNLREGAKRG